MVASAFLALWIWGVYGRAVGYDFLNYDDSIYVSANPRVLGGLSPEEIKQAFIPTIGLWHPLTWISYLVDATLFGPTPWGFHLTNVLFHLATSVLVFWVFRGATRDFWRSFCLAVFFAMHPAQVEPVAWISSRKDVLCGFFWVLTLAAYVRYNRHRSLARYAITTCLFLCSVMSKTMAMTLPMTLLVFDFWPLRDSACETDTQWSKHRILEKVPWFVLALGAILMSVYAAQTGGSLRTTREIPLLTRISHVPVYYARYLYHIAFPLNLSPHYPLHSDPEPIERVLLSLFLLSTITYGALRLRRQAPYLVTGWLWFLITLAPVSGLVQVGGQSIAMRYLYMPILGILFAATWAVADTCQRVKTKREVCAGIAAAYALALVFGSLEYVRHWRDTERVFRRVVQVEPRDDLGHATLGALLFDRGDMAAAYSHLTEALRLNPNQPGAHVGLARWYAASGRLEEAEKAYRQALALEPDNYVALTNLGALLADTGRMDEAERAYREAIAVNEFHEDAWNNLGNALAARQQFDEAIRCYERALRINPKRTSTLNNLGATYLMMGLPERALPHLQTVLAMTPNDVEARLTYAVALERLGRKTEAIDQLRQILRDHPDMERALQFLREMESPALPRMKP